MRNYKEYSILSIVLIILHISCVEENHNKQEKDDRPNILILMSDNQSWNHVGCYGDKLVSTPNIDKVAKEGIIFTNAFCAAPSCSPSRAAMLTGQDIWRLKEAANLWSGFPKVKVYSQLMEASGYTVGVEGKAWGPGNSNTNGWKQNPGGEKFESFQEFHDTSEKNKPWMYWFSSRNPHRPYNSDSLKTSKIDIANIEVPPYLPNNEKARKDIADYYHEIESFDKEVASFLDLVSKTGQLENTIIIICSDNGWQMPRGLANLYDFGTKIPLIISWPDHFKGNRVITDFVSLNDIAPTLLELASIDIPKEMTALSMVDLLFSDKSGRIDSNRNVVYTARERHAFVRRGGIGYPARAIRTDNFLYIRNYTPNRWPAGDPPLFGDVDAHMMHYSSPTKMFMLEHKKKSEIKPLFELAFGKRPKEELFDLVKDPFQLNNVANVAAYRETQVLLSKQLTDYLIATEDPRETKIAFDWDAQKYYKDRDKRPKPNKEAINALGLKEEYNYIEE